MSHSNVLPPEAPTSLLMAEGKSFLILSRHDIEHGTHQAVTSIITRWLESERAIENMAGKVNLVVDGYNEDDRDLSVIPEVGIFVEGLARLFPEFPIFLEQSLEEIFLYLTLSAGGMRLSTQGGKTDPVQRYEMHWHDTSNMKEVCQSYNDSIISRLVSLGVGSGSPVAIAATTTSKLMLEAVTMGQIPKFNS